MHQSASYSNNEHTPCLFKNTVDSEKEPPGVITEKHNPVSNSKSGITYQKNRHFKRKFFRLKSRRSGDTLFDNEEGKEKYGILLKCHKSGLYQYWQSLKPDNRVILVKYLVKTNCGYVETNTQAVLDELIRHVSIGNHFPAILAKLFFEVLFDNGRMTDVNDKLKRHGWEALSPDEKIAMLYDLSCLHPELVKNPQNIYDIAIEAPKYLEPVVVREINRLAIQEGGFEEIYAKFRRKGWSQLSVNEKVILTNGLCEQHRGVTADLDQVLYNVRVYNEIPAVVIAEKYNRAIDTYLRRGVISHLIGTIFEYHRCSGGGLINIQGVGKGRIQETIDRIKATSS